MKPINYFLVMSNGFLLSEYFITRLKSHRGKFAKKQKFFNMERKMVEFIKRQREIETCKYNISFLSIPIFLMKVLYMREAYVEICEYTDMLKCFASFLVVTLGGTSIGIVWGYRI